MELFILFLASGDWRKKLEMQPGAVLATELKNNNCKLARWTTQEPFMKYHIIGTCDQSNLQCE